MGIRVPIAIEKVACKECQYVGAIRWNPFNKVVQCHNCGQAVECIGFNFLVEGIILYSDETYKELGQFNEALRKFIDEYPAGISLLPSQVTMTRIDNPFEDSVG